MKLTQRRGREIEKRCSIRNLRIYTSRGLTKEKEKIKRLWKKQNKTESESQIAQKERESNVASQNLLFSYSHFLNIILLNSLLL